MPSIDEQEQQKTNIDKPDRKPHDQVDLRDNEVEIDLPKREENGGPQLVDELEEVIQLTWTNETLTESRTKGVLCDARPVFRHTSSVLGH
jgi:hypothetical protein